MLSRLKRWLNLDGDVPKVPAVKALLRKPGLEAFSQAATDMDKDVILRTHPFWQQNNIVQSLPVQDFFAVLRHVLDITQKFRYSTVHGDDTWDQSDVEYFRQLRGLAWAEPSQYLVLQKIALEWGHTQPEYNDEARAIVKKQIALNSGYMDINWFSQAEHGLRNGLSISLHHILHELQMFTERKQLDHIFEKHPVFSEYFDDPKYDEGIIDWIQQRSRSTHLLHWVAGHHRRLTSWVLAEHFNKPGEIEVLADRCNDGPVLKAWYGVPPTSSDVQAEPMSQLLYAQKYNASLIPPGKQLPAAWAIALSLCTTGLEFQKTLAMSQAVDQSIITLDLPEMDLGSGHLGY